MTAPADAFWNFSVATYGRPGVAAACLSLQDRRGFDVNILLLCCWAGRCGTRLSASELAHGTAAVREWQRVVVGSMRTARRFVASSATDDEDDAVRMLRRRLGALELEAERIEQRMLIAAVPVRMSRDGSPALAAVNLAAYAEQEGRPFGPEDADDLVSLVSASFPERIGSGWGELVDAIPELQSDYRPSR